VRDATSNPSGDISATSGDGPLAVEATAWLLRLASGEATSEDAAALQRWRSQSSAHRQAFAEAKLLWEVLGPAGDMVRERAKVSAVQAQVATNVIASRRNVKLGRRAFLGGALAASVAAVGYVGARPPFRLWPSPGELTADYRTGTGERQTIALADDVSIVMNTQTSIDIRSGAAGTRAFELIDGEAAVMTKASFEVFAANGRVTASSARFNMRRDQASVCVTCLEGAVRVNRHDQLVEVLTGQQVVYDDNGFRPVAPIDVAVASAWERGQLIFRHEPLARVVQELNRYRPGKIVLLNDRLGERDVVATFQLSRIDEAVVNLAQTFSARLRRLPGGMVLLS
jgi:transmembrane sensor